MKEQFINRYQISKTLQFALIPVGKTAENFEKKQFLEQDEKRAAEYEKVKDLIDRYHRYFIDLVLNGTHLTKIREYANIYYTPSKDESLLNEMTALEADLRKQISVALTSHKLYKDLFGENMIKTVLPAFLTDEEEKESVKMFQSFTTYFVGFYDNRKNMYSELEQTTAISYRCINDNLPRFLDNVKSSKKVFDNLPSDQIGALNETMLGLFNVRSNDIFNIDYFDFVLSQTGIDCYNSIIGGYTCSDGTKIKGINELINLYNQQYAKKDKSLRLPLIKPLYKQILSDRETVSFVPETFTSDDELLKAIKALYTNTIERAITELTILFDEIKAYNPDGIYVKAGSALTNLSNAVFGSWNRIKDCWKAKYEHLYPIKPGKNYDKYYETEEETYKKIKSFSIKELQEIVNFNEADIGSDITDYLSAALCSNADSIVQSYKNLAPLFDTPYAVTHSKKLVFNQDDIDLIKSFLDSIKELEWLIKPLIGTGKEDNKDEVFYGQFLPLYDSITTIGKLYDKVRNYVTSKPYSKEKIKLNFENPQLLGGWDKNKERDYRTVLLRKNGYYFLAIMDKSNSKVFLDAPDCDSDNCYEKIEYKLLPGPNKMLPKVFFAKSNLSTFMPSDHILEIRAKETFKKGPTFNLSDCHDFIDFFKASIEKHPDWSQFGFNFTPTEEYNDIGEFYSEVKKQGYSINFRNISAEYIEKKINAGELYLFQIYSKDFSECSHGTPNLHTLYFKMLFDERNLKNVSFQLNGGAEMFYRKSSISKQELTRHPANTPLKNKNPDNEKKTSIFNYELIKDKRFSANQFSLHCPITINFKAAGQEFINNEVRLAIKENESPYVIGIDRGERNLIYIAVIDSDGNIVEQTSLNEIISDNGYKVNYHTLLDTKEKNRDESRQSWKTIENIKELKEGYMSQVVHKICELVLKYDAIIALEDLNFGFKRGRFNVEKQVYQKFENMLISKLNYLCDKKADPESEGGLLNAYQLTNKFDGVNRGRQNGIIFYVPAWLTSKIDPVTGFANLLSLKYTNVIEAQTLFASFDDIRFNKSTDMFEFDLDYTKFPKCTADFKKKWTICTNADRILTYRNPEKNNEWCNKSIYLTDEFKALFNEYGINYTNNLKLSILKMDNKDFFVRLIKLLSLTLQMRNSITGNTEVDYLISPVRNSSGTFFDSRNYNTENPALPKDADANGAYNIARKALWAINVIKDTPEKTINKADLSINNAQWLEFAQK